MYEACILSEAQSLVRQFSATRGDLNNISQTFKQFWAFFIKQDFLYNELDVYDIFQIKPSAEKMRSDFIIKMSYNKNINFSTSIP